MSCVTIDKSAEKETKSYQSRLLEPVPRQNALNGRSLTPKEQARNTEAKLQHEVLAQRTAIQQLSQKIARYEASESENLLTLILEKIDEIFDVLPIDYNRSPIKSNLSKLDIIKKRIIELNGTLKEKERSIATITHELTRSSPNKTSPLR